MPPQATWVVIIGGPASTDAEVAAVFADYRDAHQYVTWWNREEIRRYGPHSGLHARAEETDFYPPGTWQPSHRLAVVGTPSTTGQRDAVRRRRVRASE